MKKILTSGLLLGALSLVLAPSVRAQITIDFSYNGTSTTLTYNVAPGSLSSLAFSGTYSVSDEHNVRNGGLVNVTASTLDAYSNPGFTNTAWGSPSVAASSFSGDSIRFFQGSSAVRIPTGFDHSSGTLAGTMTWTGLSLVDLGFASNAATSGSFAALGTTVNWSTRISSIPEPSTYATMFLGLAILGFSGHGAKRVCGWPRR